MASVEIGDTALAVDADLNGGAFGIRAATVQGFM